MNGDCVQVSYRSVSFVREESSIQPGPIVDDSDEPSCKRAKYSHSEWISAELKKKVVLNDFRVEDEKPPASNEAFSFVNPGNVLLLILSLLLLSLFLLVLLLLVILIVLCLFACALAAFCVFRLELIDRMDPLSVPLLVDRGRIQVASWLLQAHKFIRQYDSRR